MTKEEIIRTIWNELPTLTINEARKIYESTIDVIKDRLSKGEDVELRGFGSFLVSYLLSALDSKIDYHIPAHSSIHFNFRLEN